MRISDWSSDVCSSDLGQIAEAAKIDAEGRTGWHYDARITPEYGLRPQMPANIPRQFATIDLRDGSTRPATADESSLLEPDSLSGLPGAPKIVGRHGPRARTPTEDAQPLSPGRLPFAADTERGGEGRRVS